MTHNTHPLDHSRQPEQQQKPAPGSCKAAINEATAETPMTPQQREQAWRRIYRAEHQDFKGTWGGVQSLMSWAKFGGGLVTLDCITDAELRERDRGSEGRK